MPLDSIPIILHHTLTDTNSPSLLYAGEPAIGVGPSHTKMWIGDGNVNRLLLSTNPAEAPLLRGFPEPTIAGNFLRTGEETWVAGLPLRGGTLTRIDGSPSGGVGLSLTNESAATNAASLSINNWGMTTRGIFINTFGNFNVANAGIFIQHTGPLGRAFVVEAMSAAVALDIISNGSGRSLAIRGNGNAGITVTTPVTEFPSTVLGIEITSNNPGPSLRIAGPHARAEIGAASGTLDIPSGSINVASGYYVNGVALSTFPEAPADGFIHARRGSNATWLGLTRPNGNTVLGEFAADPAPFGTLGGGNTAVGFAALRQITGNRHTAVGDWAFGNLWSGNGSVAIGSDAAMAAGSYDAPQPPTVTAATDSIFIGNGVRPYRDDETNQIVIGAYSVGHGSNTVTLGNDAIVGLYCRGMLELGAPIGPAVSGQGNVNISGQYYINGAPLSFDFDPTIIPRIEALEEALSSVGTVLSSLLSGDFG